MTRGAVRALLLAVPVALLAGCTSPVRPAAAPSTGPPCLPAAAPATGTPPVTGASGSPLPALSLPCFAGGALVRLDELGRPAVVNLWASWCAPCRTEMPAIQRYAEGTGGRVTVIGVDTGDTRTGAASVLDDFKITYPNLYDQGQGLLHAIGRSALPATLLLDATGRVRYVVNGGPPLTQQALATLVRTHLGVA